MNARIRIVGEMRVMFPLWLQVVLIAPLHWLPLSWEPVHFFSQMGFWLGIPLLATTPFASEFMHGTFSQLLCQPIGRMQIWAEKMMAATVAVLTAGLVYLVVWRESPLDFLLVAGAGLLIALCSAAQSSLRAESFLLGFVTTAGAGLGVRLVWNLAAEWAVAMTGSESAVAITGSILVLGLGVMQLWDGRRTLRRFQVQAKAFGSESRLTEVVLETLGRLSRPKSRGVTLNLIRREIVLLWPAWFLSPFLIVAILGLAAFRLRTGGGHGAIVGAALGVVSGGGAMIAMLVGIASVGEEHSSGTNVWNLILPVTTRRQWAVKVGTAVVATFVCTWVLLKLSSVLMGGFFAKEAADSFWSNSFVFPSLLSLFTLVMFWAVTMLKTPVYAALLGLLAGIAAYGGFALGSHAGRRNMGSPRIIDALISALHPYPVTRGTVSLLQGIATSLPVVFVLIGALYLAIPLLQSFHFFKRESAIPIPHVIRNVFLSMVAAFLCGLVPQAPLGFASRIQTKTGEVLAEVGAAAAPAATGATDTVQLEKRLVSSGWLSESMVTVTAVSDPGLLFRDGQWRPSDLMKPRYFVTANLRGNWKCFIAEGASRGKPWYSCESGADSFGLWKPSRADEGTKR